MGQGVEGLYPPHFSQDLHQSRELLLQYPQCETRGRILNILPLVSAFILIFAIGSYTFVHNLVATVQEEKHFCGSIQVSKHYGRILQSKHYRKIKGKNAFPKEKGAEKEASSKKPYQSPRERDYPYEESKLNIRNLQNKQNPKLEELFLYLMYELYGSTALGQQQVGPFLLKLIQQSKGIQSLQELLDIAPEDKRPLLYKILKGTQNVDLNLKKGYPPLGDFVKIGEEKEKPIHICHASLPILNVCLNPKVAQDIAAEERRKWEEKHEHLPIEKKELEEILLQHDLNLSSFDELIDFVKKKTPSDEEILEEGGIKVRQKIDR